MDNAIKAMKDRIEKAKESIVADVAGALSEAAIEALGSKPVALDAPTMKRITDAVNRHVDRHVEALLK